MIVADSCRSDSRERPATAFWNSPRRSCICGPCRDKAEDTDAKRGGFQSAV